MTMTNPSSVPRASPPSRVETRDASSGFFSPRRARVPARDRVVAIDAYLDARDEK